MRRGPPSLEQSGDPQDERAGAYRGDIHGGARLAADELYGFAIAERVDHAQVSPGDADQVEGWTVRKSVRRHEAEPAIAWHGRLRFRDNVSRRLRKAREHLQRPGKIEQCQIGENDKADLEARHFYRPFVLKRERNPAGDTASWRRQTSGGGQSRPATGIRKREHQAFVRRDHGATPVIRRHIGRKVNFW